MTAVPPARTRHRVDAETGYVCGVCMPAGSGGRAALAHRIAIMLSATDASAGTTCANRVPRDIIACLELYARGCACTPPRGRRFIDASRVATAGCGGRAFVTDATILRGDGLLVVGCDCVVAGDSCLVIGDNNAVYGRKNTVLGHACRVDTPPHCDNCTSHTTPTEHALLSRPARGDRALRADGTSSLPQLSLAQHARSAPAAYASLTSLHTKVAPYVAPAQQKPKHTGSRMDVRRGALSIDVPIEAGASTCVVTDEALESGCRVLRFGAPPTPCPVPPLRLGGGDGGGDDDDVDEEIRALLHALGARNVYSSTPSSPSFGPGTACVRCAACPVHATREDDALCGHASPESTIASTTPTETLVHE